MTEEVKHYQVNGKYRVVFEKAAGVKAGDGFKVEANDDDVNNAYELAEKLYTLATLRTKPAEEK